MKRNENQIPRLAGTERLILGLLVGNGEMYGLEMVRHSEGALKRGTIYVTLNRMEEKGLVESHKESTPADSQALPRRKYRASGFGVRVLRAWEIAGASMAEEGAF